MRAVLRRLFPAACMVAALQLVSCDRLVHEYPDDSLVPVQIQLELKYDTARPLYGEVTYTTRSEEMKAGTRAGSPRYIINVYRSDDGQTFGRDVYRQQILTGYPGDGTGLDRTVTLSIEPGTYRFMVWTDYGMHYDASDFGNICFSGDYEGNTELRDAFCGTADATIEPLEGAGRMVSAVSSRTVTVQSERPLAKFNFITTDLDGFLTKVRSMIDTKDADAADGDSRSVDLSDFSVKFRYTGFCPVSFNMFSDNPSDASGGITFNGYIRSISEAEAELGFDYVFVNGHESSIPVMLEVYSGAGVLMASTRTEEVPIVRSRLTTVRGEFLSSVASGAVGIDPDYDGEYNMEIHF